MKDHVGLVVKEGEKILFIQRAKEKKTLPNIWSFPSGTIEPGESPEATAVREAKEELGIEVEVEKILTITELPEFGVRLHFVIATIKSGTATVLEPHEIQNIKWLTLPQFFVEYTDTQIGHGLIWLRQNPEVWQPDFS